MWLIYALLSAVFAAATSLLAKAGIDGVNSHLATAIRTAVVLVMAWGMVFLTDAQTGIGDISRRSWLFLILSGAATGLSWLCYYKALQMGEVTKVTPSISSAWSSRWCWPSSSSTRRSPGSPASVWYSSPPVR